MQPGRFQHDRHVVERESGQGAADPPAPAGGTREGSSRSTIRVVSVLFLDIVGYSRLHNDTQLQVRAEVARLIRECPQVRASPGDDVYVDTRAGDAAVVVFFENLLGPVETGTYLVSAARTVPRLTLRLGLHVGTVLVDGGGVPLGEALTVGQFIAGACAAGGMTASEAYVEMLTSVTDRYSGRLGKAREVTHATGKRLAVVDLHAEPAETDGGTRSSSGAGVATELRSRRGAEPSTSTPAPRPAPCQDCTDVNLAAIPAAPTPCQDCTDVNLAAIPAAPTPCQDCTDVNLAAIPAAPTPCHDCTDANLAAVPLSTASGGTGAKAPHPAPMPVPLAGKSSSVSPAPLAQIRVVSGAESGRVVRLVEREVKLGRGLAYEGTAGTIRFEEGTVSRDQALLTWDDQLRQFTVSHAGSATNPTLVNGRPPSRRQALKTGDILQMGLLKLLVELPSPPRPAAGPARSCGTRRSCHLEMVEGPAAPDHTRCVLGEKPVVIGRSGCDFVIDDPGISRRHLTVYPRGGSYWVHHESTVNPTLVNDVPVSGDVRLAPGDEIHLGHLTLLRFGCST